MTLHGRNLLNRSFSLFSMLSILSLVVVVIALLGPIFLRGSAAFFFRGTIEHRKFEDQIFGRSDPLALAIETKRTEGQRAVLYARLAAFEKELGAMDPATSYELEGEFKVLKDGVRQLLGPAPGEEEAVLMREAFGAGRWDRALVQLNQLHYRTQWDYSDPSQAGVERQVPRKTAFKGTSLESLFEEELSESSIASMLEPRFTFYWRFITDESYDSHFFGGVWPELLGTIYLTVGAMFFAIPAGIMAAIYLAEYAGDTAFVSFIRSCISTLAGVPSIVFGLFGLAFFINTVGVSPSKSVLAGALTLALLILPTIIRSAEEAIKSVPLTYKEAAMGLGASRWRTVVTVILPAALPGILTGIVISMGRAAGETAPIIFTAAVSMGAVPGLTELTSQATPALPWNIYNLCSEHEAVDQIRHVQYGMVATLVGLVLFLNTGAILLRARIAGRLRG